MEENNKNFNLYIKNWLLLLTTLVGCIIIVGGLTRLTDSGLSITRWDLISGIIPPITLQDWNNVFSLYKQIPEYKLLKQSMTLSEFKVIFWWEYMHRILGRLIGVLYFFPLLFFTIKKKLSNKNIKIFYSIFILILLQGFIGWYMVKSGLSERTDVSHYRLSLHLTIAFLIFCLLFWNYLKFSQSKNEITQNRLNFLPQFFLVIIILQISSGAFVSGLDAGKIYNTWPLMNQSYFPDDSNYNELLSLSAFESESLVQFIHRNLAYLILIVFLLITFKVFIYKEIIHLKKIVLLIFLFLLIQITLGIITVVTTTHIMSASLHQIGSIFLVASVLILIFKNSKIN